MAQPVSVDNSSLRPGREAVDLFVRSFQALLRSTGEVRIAGLVEPYLSMQPTLHPGAREAYPDAAAITYVGLRLPPCMPNVRLVLLSTSIESMAERGVANLSEWQPQVSPARRRRQYYDGGERLAMLVASPSDLHDAVPALIAYELEWNKLHELLNRDAALLEIIQQAAQVGPSSGDRERLCDALHLSMDELSRLSVVWDGKAWELLSRIGQQRKRLAVRMVGGTWNDYEHATQRWYDVLCERSPVALGERPVYLVSSNMHSLSNLLSGSVLAREREIVEYVQRSGSPLLLEEYEGIANERLRSSRENFLYYAAKKYLSEPAQAETASAFLHEEHAAGITTAHLPCGPDVDAQVIELSRLDPSRLDPRLGDLPHLDRLKRSNAVVVNIDYPLGQAAYFLQRTLARNAGPILGVYVMGKGATLSGRVGDVLLCNVVTDERTRTTYLLSNCLNAEDVEQYLVYGTALDNQRSATVPGTFLQNWSYLDSLHRAGTNLVEMEAGPYLEAFAEQVLPERAPTNEVVNLVGAGIDLGFVHYASDTPYSHGQTLGERNLSYFGMDSTYASAVAITRRILALETERLARAGDAVLQERPRSETTRQPSAQS